MAVQKSVNPDQLTFNVYLTDHNKHKLKKKFIVYGLLVSIYRVDTCNLMLTQDCMNIDTNKLKY